MNPVAQLRGKAFQLPKACIIVAGMHRSGSSATARVINLLGADISRELTPAIAGNNDRGFWEAKAILDIHDGLLKALGTTWDDPFPLPSHWMETDAAQRAKHALAIEIAKDFGSSLAFVVKDPRIARLLPLWLELLDELEIEPLVVMTVRNPLEVAASLRDRDQFPLAKSLLMYLRQALETELASRGSRRVFVRYTHLLVDWPSFAAKLAGALGSKLPETPAQNAAAIDRFLTLDLYHNRASHQTLTNTPAVPSTVIELFDRMSEAAETGNEAALRKTCDRIRATLDEATQMLQAFLPSARQGQDEAKPFPPLRRGVGDFLSPASFSFPEYLCQSEWIEHAPFAFWLVEAHRPSTLVELGSHSGFSFFAFCQAVQGLGLGTRCFAIDTWHGDGHAGSCGDEVFEEVRAHNEAHYSAFASLVRTTFDAAAPSFADGSVDLLHLDSRHAYEDVVHDFELWLPKLSRRGIVVLHNVSERGGFGVYRLWSDLKEKCPHFEFPHAHGLGIIAVDGEIGVRMRALFEAGADEGLSQHIRQAYARLGSGLRERLDRLNQRKLLEIKDADLAARAAELALLNRVLTAERSQAAESTAASAAERAKLEAEASATRQLLESKDADLAARAAELAQLNRALTAERSQAAESTAASAAERAKLEAEASAMRQLLESKDADLAARAAELAQLNRVLMAERSQAAESSAVSVAARAKLEAEVGAMKRSSSWRITHPLRLTARVFRKLTRLATLWLFWRTP